MTKRYQEAPGGLVYDTREQRVCYMVPVQQMTLRVAEEYMAQLIRILNGETVH